MTTQTTGRGPPTVMVTVGSGMALLSKWLAQKRGADFELSM